MSNTIKKIIGDLNEKKEYRETEKRAKALPAEYAKAYADIKHYLWNASGMLSVTPLISLVDMLEEAAASGRRVIDITGSDVAGFADEFVRGESSYKEQQRKKLNEKFNTK
ncbi:DUF1048 domain-containing protein [Candidatus Saccharibacteria bacterium]|nr:DUF1048 domain-containing protein [Candidatus Saccharibacteria bacterium]